MTSPVAQPARHIELRVIGTDIELASLQRALGAQRLGDVTIRWSNTDHFDRRELLNASPAKGVEGPIAPIKCWIDLSEHHVARLYFVDATHDRFMVRDLVLQEAWGSFEAESVAQIIELSLSALLSDAAGWMSRTEAQQLLESPSGTAPPTTASTATAELLAAPPPPYARGGPSPLTFGVAGFYGVRSYSKEVPWMTGPALAVSLRRGATHPEFLELAASYELPRSVQTEWVGATLSVLALRLRMLQHFRVDAHAKLWIGLQAAVGLDAVRATPVPGLASGQYQLVSSRTDVPFVIAPGASWVAMLSDHVALRILLSVDITPRPVQHSVLLDGTIRVLTETHYLRPVAQLGLCVH